MNFENISINSGQKTSNQIIQQPSSIFKDKINNTIVNNFDKF